MNRPLRVLDRFKRGLGSVFDLVVVAGYVVCFDIVLGSPVVQALPLRPFLALPLLFFLPGYVLVAALFPTHGRNPPRTGTPDAKSRDTVASLSGRRIDLAERVALSFGMSLAILPWFGLILAETPWRFSSSAVHGGLSALVLAGAVIGAVRRLSYPEDERFHVPWRQWFAELRSAVYQPAHPVDAAVNVALALSVVIALSALVYGLTVPNHQAAYTDFYLVTENGTGTPVASGYPTDFTLGEGQDLTIGVKNREGRQVSYGIVIELQRVRIQAGSATVLEERELTRVQADVDAGATWTRRLTIVPDLVGEDLRLQFYLYEGDPPSDPDPETAYHDLFLWIDVSEPDSNRAVEPIERSWN